MTSVFRKVTCPVGHCSVVHLIQKSYYKITFPLCIYSPSLFYLISSLTGVKENVYVLFIIDMKGVFFSF